MLSANTTLQNRYRIVRPLGRGGMGAVYEAMDNRLNRTVAIKETLVTAVELRRAFEREAHLLANLRHPALPAVIDHFSEGEELFLVMEYIPGRDLGETLVERNSRPFAVTEVSAWAEQLLDALNYLHTLSPPVIHRDIKPANLKLLNSNQIVLLDFGLAKGTSGQMSTVTATHSILGYTPSYAPLEQIQGAGTDPRSDLYALGATLYHLLTGTRPADALQRANAVLHGQPDPLSPARELNSEVTQNLSTLLMQAMALNSAARPASALAMRQALRDNQSHAAVAAAQSYETTFDKDETTVVTAQASRIPAVASPIARPQQQVVIPIHHTISNERSAAAARRGWALATLVLATAALIFVGWSFMRWQRGSAAPARSSNVNAKVSNSNQNAVIETPTLLPTVSPEALRAREELQQRNLALNTASFLRAVERGDPELVHLYLAAEIDPDAIDARRRTALQIAAANGSDHIAQELLRGGADVNAADERRATALMWAASSGHTDTSRVLVERGADVNLQDDLGQTALLRAAKEGHKEIVLLLINKNADVNVRDNSGRGALKWAEINKHREVAELLRKADAN